MSSLTVSSGTSISSYQQLDSTSRSHHRRGQSPIDAVTSVLGMSASDITSALQQGKSLNDLATQQGVSHADLISALKAGMPSDLQSRSDVDQLLESLASSTGLPGVDATQATSSTAATSSVQGASAVQGTSGTSGVSWPHAQHQGGHGSAARVRDLDGTVSGVMTGSLTQNQQVTLDSLAGVLGTNSSGLMSALKSGTSLADLVSSKGVDTTKLAGILQDGLMADTRS